MSFWKKYRKLHIWLAVDLAVLGLYLALRQNRQLMNSFADHVTTPLKAALGRLCALTSLSVMEILYALAAVVAVAYTVWSVIAVVKARSHRGRRVYSALLGAADGILTVYVLFCLMWGVNYWTDSFQDRSGITAQPVAAEDLKNVTAYFAERLSETADTVPRDENGVYAVPKEQILSESRSVYGGVTELFPFLEFPDTGVKAVRGSRIMSVMGFTGVYFACVGEWFLGSILFLYLLFPLLQRALRRNIWLTWGVTLAVCIPIHLLGWDVRLVAVHIPEFLFGMTFLIMPKRAQYMLPAALLAGAAAARSLDGKITCALAGAAVFILLALAAPLLDRPWPRVLGARLAKISYAVFLVHHVLIQDMAAHFDLAALSRRDTAFLYVVYLAAAFAAAEALLWLQKTLRRAFAALRPV